MSDELSVAARAAQELEPSARQVAAAVAGSGPAQVLVDWITHELRYRLEPRKARTLMRAAERVEATGLPPRSIDDRLLRSVLEAGALEADETMQERWANLLAHGVVDDRAPHVAFPSILAQLTPIEARMLETMHGTLNAELWGTSTGSHRTNGFEPTFFLEKAGVAEGAYPAAAANLDRLGLAEQDTVRTGVPKALSTGIQISYFGALFVIACSPPGTASRVNGISG